MAHTLVLVDPRIAEERLYVEALVRSTNRFRVVEPLACPEARVSGDCLGDDRCIALQASACGVEVVVIWEPVDASTRGLRVLRHGPPYASRHLVPADLGAWAPALGEALLGTVTVEVSLGQAGGITLDGQRFRSEGGPLLVEAQAGKAEIEGWAKGYHPETRFRVILPGERPQVELSLYRDPRPGLPLAPFVALGLGLVGGIAAGIAVAGPAAGR